MCRPNLRATFWASSLIALSLASMFSEWDGASFWAVFCAFIAMGIADNHRNARSC